LPSISTSSRSRSLRRCCGSTRSTGPAERRAGRLQPCGLGSLRPR
jgi:hypothetical protein